jgi:hypothetical protein
VDIYYDDYLVKELVAGINTVSPPGSPPSRPMPSKNNHNGTQLDDYGGEVECDGWFFTSRS